MKKYKNLLTTCAIMLALLTCFAVNAANLSADGRMKNADLAFYKQALSQADKENKHVMIYFGADWCKYCDQFDNETLADKKVDDRVKANFVPMKINIDNDKTGLVKKYKVRALPTIMFFDPEGQMAGSLPGFVPADVFHSVLGYISDKAYKEMNFTEYIEKKTK